MASYNHSVLAGHLTRDLELKHIGHKGTACCEFSLAVNDKRKNASGEWVEEVSYIDGVAYGRTAEVMSEYLHKGSFILVDGRLKQDRWEQDGQKRSKVRLVVDTMQMLDKKGGESNQSSQPRRNEYSAPAEERRTQPATDEGDIPFSWLLPLAISLASLGGLA